MNTTTEVWQAVLTHRAAVRTYFTARAEADHTTAYSVAKAAMPNTLYLEGRVGPWRGPLMKFLLATVA
jgi:hypothetical protein